MLPPTYLYRSQERVQCEGHPEDVNCPNVAVGPLTVPLQTLARTSAVLTEVLQDFLSLSRQIPVQYLKLGHGRVLSHPSQFITLC
jgi:hypothetical protein